jgi:lipopolysaccharide cholinephosphotransferase
MSSPLHSGSAETAFADGRLRQAQLKMLAMLEVVDHICLKHKLDYWLDAGTLLGAVRHQGFIPWDDDIDIAMPRASYEAFLRIAPTEMPDHMWLQTIHTDPGFFNMAAPLKIRDLHSRLIEKHEQGDEPYVQGIFIDVFVYDGMSANPKQRKRHKWIAKKIARILSTHYSCVPIGHYAAFYHILGLIFSKARLERRLQHLIQTANQQYQTHLGRGYQCVGQNVIPYHDIYPLKRGTFETGYFNIPNHPDPILKQQYGDYWSLPPLASRTIRHCKELIPAL